MNKGIQMLAFFQRQSSRLLFKSVKMPSVFLMRSVPRFAFCSGSGHSKNQGDHIKKQTQTVNNEKGTKEQIAKSGIVEMKDQAEWQTEVIDSQIPVVLDCYADWCQPCKQLTPILEEKAGKADGKWKLVKLNIDKFPQLANALQIKSIPTVYLIDNKNAVDGFVGTPSQKELDQFFENIKSCFNQSPEEDEFKEQFVLAATFIESNCNLKEASEIVNKLLSNEGFKTNHGGKLNGLLALLSAKESNQQGALKYLNEIRSKFSEELKNDEGIKKLIKTVEDILEQLKKKQSEDPEIDRLKQEVQSDPSDLHKLFALSKYQTEKNLHEDAVDNLFNIIKANKNWENKKANKLLIDIFSQLGATHELTISGRKRLQRFL